MLPRGRLCARREAHRGGRDSSRAGERRPPGRPQLAGTAGLNVPMFIALRRFTLLFTILLERFWLRKLHDWPTLVRVQRG